MDNQDVVPVVLITIEGNVGNLYSIIAADYPRGAAPEVGDCVPLVAKMGDITFLDGKYLVMEVLAGSGYDLLPEAKPFPGYDLIETIEGFGVKLHWKPSPLGAVEPVQPRLDFVSN